MDTTLGLSQASISRWEAGRGAPGELQKCRIAGAFGMEVAELFPLLTVITS